jgi:acyl dehydratase
MTLTASWNEVSALEGAEFTGDWFAVAADRIALFEHATYTDENINSMDESGYPENLVEGFHLLSLLDHLVNRAVHVSGPGVFGWNYGFDRVRFTSPVTADDPIRVCGRVAEVTARGEGYLLRLEVRIEVEGRTKPAMVADWRVLWEVSA